MSITGVRFDEKLFVDHPDGWQSPNDLAEGFLLAWALEMQQRQQIDPVAPFANHVRAALPPAFRYDTLGELVRLPTGSGTRPAVSTTALARLTLLCVAWRLFDEMNNEWMLRSGDFVQYGDALSFATGGTDRHSLFGDLDADLAKCLLSDRIQRAYRGTDDLTQAERWFVTGDPHLLTPDSPGYDIVPFNVGGSYVPIILTGESFASSIWAAARVLVERSTPATVVARYAHRRSDLLDVLERGAVLAQRRQLLPPAQAWNFDSWPGWA